MAYHHQRGVYDPKFHRNRELRDLEDMLSEWYGSEFAASEITARTDSPQSIAESLDKVLDKKMTSRTMQVLKLRDEWDELIGPPLNKFVHLVTIDNENTAVIEVAHPAFLIELKKKSTMDLWIKKLSGCVPELQQVRFVPVGQK